MGWGGGRAGGLIKLFCWSAGCERCRLRVQDKFSLFSAGCCRALNQLCEKWAVFGSRQQRGTLGQRLNSSPGELPEAVEKSALLKIDLLSMI